MGFQISPGIQIQEYDLSAIIPAVATTEGAVAIKAIWGPIDDRVLIDSEDELVATYRQAGFKYSR